MQRHTPTPQEFVAAQQSAEFQELRSKQRGFTFPLTVAGIVWFVIYILTAMYTPDFFGHAVFGNVNIGILFGFAQFVTTFLITWLYVNYSNKNLEPRARAIRESLEGSPHAASHNPNAQA
ncbi:DUF485 domain-containing protein [Corynebacterium sp. 4HC-13]|uniref:DUF485 domain-containing protein n=2 Tax=Corynebacterium anserum TaxID=2684406 RepID=A0A7G7YQV5_9CORY|nr:DUF485 domain-containing protein [Corynebacterium anserum]MBC2680993.1 DUF485 domain-containing protein [Corynebacterium anserum]QNH96875.1 DUF485 domain-containing protein [Corynebacterium anserum]